MLSANLGVVKVGIVDEWLQYQHNQNRFNGGILIAQGGDPLLMKTYGVADAAGTRPLTLNTPFRLASLSKQFTAVAILCLVDQGNVQLDAPVATYLDQFPYPTVTVRHLLNHTSGLPDFYIEQAIAAESRGENIEIVTVANVVQRMIDHAPQAIAEPQSEFVYCNNSYVLLAGIIEAVSGCSFESFLQEKLFIPLGMKQSRVWNVVSPTPFEERAHDFEQNESGRTSLPPVPWDGVAGDGAVFCSLNDLLIWSNIWRNPYWLPAELTGECFKKPILTDNSVSTYGFGWLLETDYMWHNGQWLGARNHVCYYPENEIWVAILNNSAIPHIEEIIIPKIEQTLQLQLRP